MSTTNPNLFDRAHIVKQQLAEVREKISEGVSELSHALKAYIGDVDEAAEYQRDNKYIMRGYRINHHTCRSLFKSLFTCHNESVNVWSHIAGVIVFLTLMIVICIEVMPNQFWYAYDIEKEFVGYQEESATLTGLYLGDPVVFADAKIVELKEY